MKHVAKTNMNNGVDVVIVGTGPSGLSTGIQLAEFGLRVVALDANSEPGGVIRKVKRVDYYPGFPGGISSGELIRRLVQHAKKSGLAIRTNEEVTRVSLKRKDKLVETVKSKYSAKAVVVASGSPDGEDEGWFGSGIFYCVECCADFLRERSLILIGSNSKAVEESLNLINLASHVTLVNQANSIALTRRDRAKLKQRQVDLVEDYVLARIESKPLHKSVTLRGAGHGRESTVEADGVVIIGNPKPIVEILHNEGVMMHRQGCITVDNHGRTNIDGVFAAGPCTSVCKVGVPLCVGEGTNVAAAVRFHLWRARATHLSAQIRI